MTSTFLLAMLSLSCSIGELATYSDDAIAREQLIAAPDNFSPSRQPSPPSPIPSVPNTPPPAPTPPVQEKPQPVSKPTIEELPPPVTQPVNPPKIGSSLSESDRIAAQRAWNYFKRNWNPKTGLVNGAENLTWMTFWDQGSAILGIHAAHQLGIIDAKEFAQKIAPLLQTLETLPLPATGLPNKAYSTTTAQMRKLNNTPDPQGTSGWSALDMARFLVGLHVLRSHYPQYRTQIEHIVSRWQLSKLVKDGWLHGGFPGAKGQFRLLQEGRLGYEQYAAESLKIWGIEAKNALSNPPVETIAVDGISLQSDRRNLHNSGATNYLTSDPYLLWGLEIGWTDTAKQQAQNLFRVQEQRFKRTGILTAVNEDSLDRPPYFLYYSVYANGQPWNPISAIGKSYPHLRFISTKAAFAWQALMLNEYSQKLREVVQNLADPKRGYLSGRYENKKLGINRSIDVNTNAIVLESLLYRAKGNRPLSVISKG